MSLASSKAKIDSVKRILSEAKKSPGGIIFGTPGLGSQEDLLMKMIADSESIPILSVPYKGVDPALDALVAGEVQVWFASPGLAMALTHLVIGSRHG